MQPDIKASIDFLKKFHPEGPWVLTAIGLDRSRITTDSFEPKDTAAVTKWLEKYGGERNIYFLVNRPIGMPSKKPQREHIQEMAWLHIDIDPEDGADLDAERDRCLALLTSKLPKGIPPPTCVVFSGGGYQGFWRLKEPLSLGGNLEKAEDAKLYNMQLETIFGGDHCHNIDRIMRLPGTINIPNAKKAAKGRKREMAKVFEFNKNSYDLSKFKKQPKVQDGTKSLGASTDLELKGEIPLIDDVSYLDQWDVPDRLKVIAVQGRHPDEVKEGDNSRSAWVFDFVCNMARCGVPDEVTFAILMHPDFGISSSVREAKPTPERYALRQIARGKEYAIDPVLAELNHQHAVIGNVGGSCKVIEEVDDPTLNRSRLTFASFTDFRNRYMNKKIKIGEDRDGNPKFMELGKWWLQHSHRRQYRQVVFRPGAETPEDYNMWRGFAVAPQPGDWSIFRDHLYRNVCGENEEHFNYLLGWMARTVQQPDTPGEVAVVLRSGKGTGKSKVATTFGSLFGRHMLHIANASHLVGNFNSHLRDALVLFADEAFFAGDKKHESVLKTIITERTIQIEAKGVDVQTQPNYIHLIMASNSDWVVPAGPDERRFFVLEVGDGNKQDTTFFAALDAQMANGGREGLLYDLLNLDITEYDVRKVPQTDALTEQKRRSMDIVEEWWYRCLKNGRILRYEDNWKSSVPTAHLYEEFKKYLEQWNIFSRHMNETIFGRELAKCTTMRKIQKRMNIEEQDPNGGSYHTQKRVYVYEFPDLEDCRAEWDRKYFKEDWSMQVQEDETVQTGQTPF